MTLPVVPLGADTSFHAVQRRMAGLLSAQDWQDVARPLELSPLVAQDPPRLIDAEVIEERLLQAHPVTGELAPGIDAFLDGTQTSRPIVFVDGVPVVHGVTAAVVRVRVDRRMRTWEAPLVDRRIYAPMRLLPPAWRNALETSALPLVDTLESRPADSTHPFALQDAAVHAVQQDREDLERTLAERWCGEPPGVLLMDGSISGSELAAGSPHAVGLIKSHQTLYVDQAALRTVLRLAPGERTSVFRITSPKRTPVASWYLRLRGGRGHDPMWGLVRVEVSDAARAGRDSLAERANTVSRWVLAEALPLSLPDARWDRMLYGIRDCEEFLRAIQ